MALWLRQSTASQEILLGRFVDSTDGNTEETGLTIANTDIKLWREGATTLADKNSGGATHIANGNYSAVLDATDSATLGKLEVHVHVSGALSVKREYMVLPAMVYDFFVLGTDRLDTNVTHVGDTSQTARDLGASVLLSSGTGTGQVSLSSGLVRLSSTGVQDVLTTAMTEAYAADGAAATLAQAIYLIMQRLTEFSISGTTVTVKQLDGSATAATLTLDDATSPTSSTRAS